MAKYIVEYAKFVKVEIEAESKEEADDIAHTMEEDEIDQNGKSYDPYGYVVWNDPAEIS